MSSTNAWQQLSSRWGGGLVPTPEVLQCREVLGAGLHRLKHSLVGHRLAHANSLYKRDLQGHFGCVNAIEFSNDGEIIASGGDDRRLLIWNIGGVIFDDKHPTVIDTQHTSNINTCCFDVTNLLVTTGGNDGMILTHDINRQEVTCKWEFEAAFCLSADPINSTNVAVACDDGKIFILDSRMTGAALTLASCDGAMHSVQYSPVLPQLLASANARTGTQLWDLRRPQQSLRYSGRVSNCMSVSFNQRGDRLLALRRRSSPLMFDVLTGRPLHTFDYRSYYNSCTLKSCCFAGLNDEYIVTGSDDFCIYMWKVPSDSSQPSHQTEPHMILKGHRSIVNQVRYCRVNQMLISAGVEKLIKLWSPYSLPGSTGRLRHSRRYGDDDELERNAYSHEEYIHMVLMSDNFLSHDYTHGSTAEDPCMIAFFDSLIQREVANSPTTGRSDSDDDWQTEWGIAMDDLQDPSPTPAREIHPPPSSFPTSAIEKRASSSAVICQNTNPGENELSQEKTNASSHTLKRKKSQNYGYGEGSSSKDIHKETHINTSTVAEPCSSQADTSIKKRNNRFTTISEEAPSAEAIENLAINTAIASVGQAKRNNLFTTTSVGAPSTEAIEHLAINSAIASVGQDLYRLSPPCSACPTAPHLSLPPPSDPLALSSLIGPPPAPSATAGPPPAPSATAGPPPAPSAPPDPPPAPGPSKLDSLPLSSDSASASNMNSAKTTGNSVLLHSLDGSTITPSTSEGNVTQKGTNEQLGDKSSEINSALSQLNSVQPLRSLILGSSSDSDSEIEEGELLRAMYTQYMSARDRAFSRGVCPSGRKISNVIAMGKQRDQAHSRRKVSKGSQVKDSKRTQRPSGLEQNMGILADIVDNVVDTLSGSGGFLLNQPVANDINIRDASTNTTLELVEASTSTSDEAQRVSYSNSSCTDDTQINTCGKIMSPNDSHIGNTESADREFSNLETKSPKSLSLNYCLDKPQPSTSNNDAKVSVNFKKAPKAKKRNWRRAKDNVPSSSSDEDS